MQPTYRDALRRAAGKLDKAADAAVWVEAKVSPEEPWGEEIRQQMIGARLVLVLVSPDLLEARWCIGELLRAFELRNERCIDLVPVVVRPCAWRETALGIAQALPAGGAPIENWPDAMGAWSDVVDELARLWGGERRQPAFPSREELVRRYAEILEADRRLMLLAPWRTGQEELAQETARSSFGDAITTLRIPPLDEMTPRTYSPSSPENPR